MIKKAIQHSARFFFLCLLLGILFEQCFDYGRVGLSYLIFVIGFYGVFMWHFRKKGFHHRRFGVLVMTSIGAITATYLVYDNLFFYVFNILVIPCLVVIHCVLLVSPEGIKWQEIGFIRFILLKVKRIFTVNIQCLSILVRPVRRRMNDEKYELVKKIVIGFAISLPLLLIILVLLSSADAVFGELISRFPEWLASLNIGDLLSRLIIICIATFGFFGFILGLGKHEKRKVDNPKSKFMPEKHFDKIITMTFLVFINAVYALFTIVQFKYFFGGELVDGLTYAEYARHGFVQLVLVTLINLTILIIVIRLMKSDGKIPSIQVMLTLMILFSGVMLWSAIVRLLLYENAYGFTVSRMLAHAFMLFLILIFAYTLVKVWIQRLSLIHFYIISSLIFYTIINLIDIDQWVVNENLARYEQTGKVDIDYLDRLSSTGVTALIDLYEEHPDIEGLQELLTSRKVEAERNSLTWRSYNLSRATVYERLKGLEIPK